MNRSVRCLLAAALLLGGCASVTTHVVQLNPAVQFPPSQHVSVLLQQPTRAHVDIALIESHGTSEAEMLNDAREKAAAIGADAIVKLETDRQYHAPVAVYDPWYDPAAFGYYGYRPWSPYPYRWGSPYAPYQMVGGGYTYVLTAIAIKYSDAPPSGKSGGGPNDSR
jgi:hypothetical protein